MSEKDKKEDKLPDMEQKFAEASQALEPLYSGNPQGFNAPEFIKKMREIRQHLNEKMKKLGLFNKTKDQPVLLNERFASLLMSMNEAMVTHSAQANYVDELNIALQLYDSLRTFVEV